jgi:hypothetical protein
MAKATIPQLLEPFWTGSDDAMRGSVNERVRLFPPKSFLHAQITFRGSIVPCSEPPIERQKAVRIVHLEILVVKVVRMGMGINCPIRPHLNLVETDMSNHSAGSGHLRVLEHQKRVRRQDQVDQYV